MGDLEGASVDYETAYDLKNFGATNLTAPNYLSRGYAKARAEDWKDSFDDYNKAVELKPDWAVAYAERGLAKSKLGDLTGALVDLDKAIELEPNIPEFYTGRSQIKKLKGDVDGALADADRYLELKHKQILKQLQNK